VARVQQLNEIAIEPIPKVPEVLRKTKTGVINQSAPPVVAPSELPPLLKQPMAGVQFENKQLLIYYKREELCRSVCGLPIW
jgi:hypothetical protein